MTDKQIINKLRQQLKSKEQNLQEAMDTSIKEFNRAEELKTLLKSKEQECDELKSDLTDLSKIIDCKNGTILTFKEQLAQLKEENDRLRKRIVTIFDCLIKANRDVIVDTLWVDKITTLWDYIAQTLGIEGDQNQIEEQVKMLYSEGE